MFEVGGLDEATAREALSLARRKFAIKTKVIARHDVPWERGMKPMDFRKLSFEEIRVRLLDSREELMKLRFQQVNGPINGSNRSASTAP